MIPRGRGRTFNGPIFEAVWPKEAQFRRPAVSHELAGLCVSAAAAFRASLAGIRHHFVFVGGRLERKLVPEVANVTRSAAMSFLELLWILCGPASPGHTDQ